MAHAAVRADGKTPSAGNRSMSALSNSATPSSHDILRRLSPERAMSLEQRVLSKAAPGNNRGARSNGASEQAAEQSPSPAKPLAGTPTAERGGRKKRTPVKSALAQQQLLLQQQRARGADGGGNSRGGNNSRGATQSNHGASVAPASSSSSRTAQAQTQQQHADGVPTKRARVPSPTRPRAPSPARTRRPASAGGGGTHGHGHSRGTTAMSQLSFRTVSTELNGSRSNSMGANAFDDLAADSSSDGGGGRSRGRERSSLLSPASRSQSRDGQFAPAAGAGGRVQQLQQPRLAQVLDDTGWVKHVPPPAGRSPRGAAAAGAAGGGGGAARQRSLTTPEKQAGGGGGGGSGRPHRKRGRSDGRVSATSSRDGFGPVSIEDVPSNQPAITSFFTGGGGVSAAGSSSSTQTSASCGGVGGLPTQSSSSSVSSATVSSSSSGGGGGGGGGRAGSYSQGIGDKFARQRVQALEAQLQAQVASYSALEVKNAQLCRDVQHLEEMQKQSHAQAEQAQVLLQQRMKGMVAFFEGILREKVALERAKKLQDIAAQNVAVGRVVYARVGPHVQDLWCDGEDFARLRHEQARAKADREAVEAQRRDLNKLFRKARTDSARSSPAGASSSSSSSSNHNSGGGSGAPSSGPGGTGGMRPPSHVVSGANGSGGGSGGQAAAFEYPLELVEREESLRMALNDVKRRDAALAAEEQALLMRKKLHLLDVKRASDAAESRFSRWPTPLNGRYVLVDLLGKGGFSEVWKAVDLHEFQYVACKIHQLNPMWSDAKKKNYTKHATREYAIHKALKHNRVVPLCDVFEIDTNSFATVLEYCPGPDLSVYLKENPMLSEKQARGIIIQVLSALRYLSGQKQKIIHYDLKPANILMVRPGEVKITDFGLSKIMQEDADDSRMELTSQGAGTYWYLPPECFVAATPGSGAPRISSKVDVWSVGVIFYQMLFGKRPFGDGMSQDNILRQGTMLQARSVRFPASVKCSPLAKEFMLACLQHSQERRASVEDLCRHPYITQRLK